MKTWREVKIDQRVEAARQAFRALEKIDESFASERKFFDELVKNYYSSFYGASSKFPNPLRAAILRSIAAALASLQKYHEKREEKGEKKGDVEFELVVEISWLSNDFEILADEIVGATK